MCWAAEAASWAAGDEGPRRAVLGMRCAVWTAVAVARCYGFTG